MTDSKWTERLSLAGVFVVAGIILAVFTFSESVREGSMAILEWFDGKGAWGVVLYIGMYSILVLFLVPAVFFTLGAGFVFGFWIGIVVVLVSMSISAPIAFLLARHTFGERVARRLREHPRLRMLNKGLEREGWKIVLLSRLVPGFPFKLSNYFFGLTKISLRGFFTGSFLGLLPLTVVNVYVGTLAGRLVDLVENGPEPWQWVLYGIGLVAAVILVVVIVRMARAAIRKAVAEENGESA